MDWGTTLQATPFPKIVAFVEGTMEKFFFNTNFHYVDVVPVINGKSVSPDQLADNISSLYRAKDPHVDLIIVWVDGEGRPEPATAIREKIRQALLDSGAPEEKLYVGVPDEMTENWLLADENMIRGHFALDGYVYEGEGTNGKSTLKKLFKDRDEHYKETLQGVALMKKMRLTRSALSSASAREFCGSFEIDCWWWNIGEGAPPE